MTTEINNISNSAFAAKERIIHLDNYLLYHQNIAGSSWQINIATDVFENNGFKKPDKNTGSAFPGSQHVKIIFLQKGYGFASSHLMKNDLNGLFLTDQPGQPFKGDPGNNAGSDLPPP